MRLPRVQFTMGTLLFAVALVAANCRVLQLLYERVKWWHGSNPLSQLTLGFSVGLLPLLNVALVETAGFVAGRFRSAHAGPTGPRSTSVGGLYFRIQFLALGCLSALFMADDIRRCLQMLEPLTWKVEQGWAAVFDRYGNAFPWIVLDCLLYGLLLSGPPLLLSWIGQALATRFASTLPRCRFRAMTCLVSLGFASTALAICLAPQPFEEEQEVDLDFLVVDEASGQPLATAFLRMTDPFSRYPDSIPPGAFTNADGCARLTGRFFASGQRNAFQTMGVFSPWGRWLEVSAAGHRTRYIPLTEVLGTFAEPAYPGSCKITLARGETRAGPFRDLAGIYTDGGQGFGGRWFEIKPDGRFAWCEWGCVPPDSQEYGFVKRRDRAIVLVPVRHPGRDIDPQVAVEYLGIEWGDRLYLSTTDQHALREFCRAALSPAHPSDSEYIDGSYLRESDRNTPRTGMPRLSLGVWVKFLIDEMSLNNEEGSLRLVFDSLISRNSPEGRSANIGREQ